MLFIDDFSRALGSSLSAIYISLAMLSTASVLIVLTLRSRQKTKAVSYPRDTKSSASSTATKNPPRAPGKWIPSSFRRPTTVPYPDWSITETKPLPYRPFRWGTYHITMGLRSLAWDDWIELDNRYLEYHAIKAARIAERGPKCSRTAPEGFDGACELLEELAAYLPDRYPSLFRRTQVGVDNLVTGESFNVVERPLKEDPMQMAGRLVQDDLAIMFEKEDGQVYFLAGTILLAGFWRLEDKFGMSLAEIHTSGNVPGFKEKLQKGMENFFARITPEKPVVRHNYFFQVDGNLAWSDSLGGEDLADDGSGSVKMGWITAEGDKSVQEHRFRSERQTLRRLPRSGGVAFTIRTYFEKVTDIAEEPGVPGRLASGVRGWPESVDVYKGKVKWEEELLEYLDEKHREQKETGLVTEEEDQGQYPY